jgi:3-phenylpropionate/trans-cinnamate dioxygenase ferredoxin reductase subunit
VVPWFWSDQYDVNLQRVGLPAQWDEALLRGDPAGKSFTVIYLDRGVIVAADAINRPRDIAPVRSAIEKRATPDRAALADPGLSLPQALKTQRRIEDVA